MAKRKRADTQAVQKWKKKTWHKLVAPAFFDHAELGECLAEGTEPVKGRVIEANLMHLTKNMKKQNISAKFKVVDVKEGVGHTQMTSYWMIPSSIKRLVRTNRDRIDMSFAVKTTDDIIVRVKPLLITRNNMSAQQRTVMRKLIEGAVFTFFEKCTYEAFVKAVLSGELTKLIKESAGRIGPVRSVEIRSFAILQTTKNVRFAQPFSLPEREQPAVKTAKQPVEPAIAE